MGNEDIRWQQRFQNFEKSLDHLRFSEPDSTEVLGKVKIGDSGFTTNCSYEAVINKAKMGSRKVGGNAINWDSGEIVIIFFKEILFFDTNPGIE